MQLKWTKEEEIKHCDRVGDISLHVVHIVCGLKISCGKSFKWNQSHGQDNYGSAAAGHLQKFIEGVWTWVSFVEYGGGV